jgi:hypothetical protein
MKKKRKKKTRKILAVSYCWNSQVADFAVFAVLGDLCVNLFSIPFLAKPQRPAKRGFLNRNQRIGRSAAQLLDTAKIFRLFPYFRLFRILSVPL